MKLQILIPRYNEPEEIIDTLLKSIALQQHVDFNDIGVIICDDGSDSNLSSDFLNAYPFTIQYTVIPHSGVSTARQVCLDIAEADYVMWCDADDMFYNSIGMFTIFRAIDDGGFHMMESLFIEEIRDENGNPAYIEHDEYNNIFIHGKIFNRNWLVENAIYWDTSLLIHEDSYFVSLARECCGTAFPDYRYCDMPFYLWKYFSQSISRLDSKHYAVKTFGNLIDSIAALIRELFKRNMQNRAYDQCCNLIFTLYYYCNTDTFLDEENQEYVKKINSKFRDFYNEFGWLFEEISLQDKLKKSQDIRNMIINDPIDSIGLEHFTFEEWLHNILEEEA